LGHDDTYTLIRLPDGSPDVRQVLCQLLPWFWFEAIPLPREWYKILDFRDTTSHALVTFFVRGPSLSSSSTFAI
jgi:hypothetical protein